MSKPHRYLLPIGSDKGNEFRKDVEAVEQGKKKVLIKTRTKLSHFVEFTFVDREEVKKE